MSNNFIGSNRIDIKISADFEFISGLGPQCILHIVARPHDLYISTKGHHFAKLKDTWSQNYPWGSQTSKKKRCRPHFGDKESKSKCNLSVECIDKQHTVRSSLR